AQRRGGGERQEPGGRQQVEALGDRQQTAAAQDERSAAGRIGPDQVVRQPEPLAEPQGPRFVGDEAVGAGFQQEAVDAFGLDHAAGAPVGVENRQADRHAAGASALQQGVGGGQTGDAGADDGDVERRGGARVSHASARPTWPRTSSASRSRKAGWLPAVPARWKPRPAATAAARAWTSRSNRTST